VFFGGGKKILGRYLYKEIDRFQAQALLGVKKTHLFKLVKEYRNDPDGFSIDYKRAFPNNSLPAAVGEHIVAELAREKEMIENPAIPLRFYNYSYIQQILADSYHEKVSLPAIIATARKHGFHIPKKERKPHDREVSTHYAGELLQHDTSYHLFAPYAGEKWYLITTLDDFSRMIVFGQLVKKETSWNHILAFQHVCLTWGVPFCYYVDNHSVFRFVQGRDSMWRKHVLATDDVETQWKQVLQDLRVRVTYALSPQAKGKIERPYRWLQDRLVRTCARQKITEIEDAQQVLGQETHRYNYHQVHSTTGEIPIVRFETAAQGKQSLFRELTLPYPFTSPDDVFCLRTKRTVDSYRNISLNNLKLRVHNVPIRQEVNLRITPDPESDIYEVRIWYKGAPTDNYRIKASDLKGVQF
jgi:hypothetical protein